MDKKTKPRKKSKEAPVDAPFDHDKLNELLKKALEYDPRKKKSKK